MFETIIIVLKCFARVKGRVNINTFHLSGVFLLQRLEREEVVAVDEQVVEDVVRTAADGRVLGLRRILDQHARLKARTLLLADPSEFKLRVLGHAQSPNQ